MLPGVIVLLPISCKKSEQKGAPVLRALALPDEILMQVDKAARYIGGEINAVMKEKEKSV